MCQYCTLQIALYLEAPTEFYKVSGHKTHLNIAIRSVVMISNAEQNNRNGVTARGATVMTIKTGLNHTSLFRKISGFELLFRSILKGPPTPLPYPVRSVRRL